MRVFKRGTLKAFWETRPEAEPPLRAWFKDARTAGWATPRDVKNWYPSASILKDNRVVFNIGGNKFRLVVKINYPYGQIFVRFIGTHADYDKIDAETV
ncbi:MAG: type II toxin-antitoxin system HigB family toxin [Alphaproteobacteria bacterium]|nr:type II toxin-antitoxin system HigB family toxin [Alphaproteobacteria bacterium]